MGSLAEAETRRSSHTVAAVGISGLQAGEDVKNRTTTAREWPVVPIACRTLGFGAHDVALAAEAHLDFLEPIEIADHIRPLQNSGFASSPSQQHSQN